MIKKEYAMKKIMLMIICLTHILHAMDDASSSSSSSVVEPYPVLLRSISSSSSSSSADDESLLTRESFTENSIEEQKQQYNAFSQKTLADLTDADWKKSTKELDFSNKELTTVKNFAAYCKDIPSQPPLFPYRTITKIILKNNALKEIKGAWFDECWDLRYLDVSHNNIQQIDLGELFRNLLRLKYFDGSYNGKPTIQWSEHRVWTLLREKPAPKYSNSVPIIKLIGNGVEPTDQQWLQDRYQKELNRLMRSSEIGWGVRWGGGMGTIIGLVPAVLAGAICSPYAAFALPAGSIGGSLMCISTNMLCGYDKEEYTGGSLRVYFEEDSNASYSEHREKPISCQWAACL